MTRISLILTVLLAGLFGVGAWGSYRWHRQSTDAATRLECCAVANPLTYDPAVELAGLPDPVQRYFRYVLRPGQVMIRRARQVQTGEFNMGKGWTPLRASQTSIVRSPGFVWDARLAVVPRLLDAEVRDSYSNGNASMTAKVLGLVTMMDLPNGPELASGALQRHLAESVFFPTALLPSQGVVWTPIDADSARATLTDRDITVSLDFHFDNTTGEITGAYTKGRYKEKNGMYSLMPWETTCSQYEERGGMKIPIKADVAWIVEGQRMPYWRASITQIEYE